MINNIGSALLIVLLWGAAGFFRSWRGTWFAPSAFVGLLWASYITLSLIMIDRHVSIFGLSILVVLISVIQTGSFLMERNRTRNRNIPVIPERRLWRCAVICTLLAGTGIIYLIWISLAMFSLDISLFSLLHIGGFWTLQRYQGILEPWPYRLLIIWFHPAALLGGIIFTFRGYKAITISVLTLIPGLLCTVLTGARAAFIISLACWLGGYFAVTYLRGQRAMFRWRALVAFASTAAILLVLFVTADAIRATDKIQEFVVEADRAHIQDYMFGSVAAFDYWADHVGTKKYYLGARTFAGLYDVLQLKSRTLGTYEDDVSVISGYYTNIYTVFRGLIEDFTFLGAALLCALVGLIGGYAFSSDHRFAPLILSGFYAFIMFSPLYSLFSLNGTVLAWVMGYLVFRQVGKQAIGKPLLTSRYTRSRNS